ncbi:hypothetical protein OA57_09815 [Chelonobacter oris]|uniref:DUF2547 domain-containing protein n=1 Tax=Chelonobacter oris TaxID=505317 RepID=A0A0A3AQ56_9PAST|nr:secA translation cis-regulator SecM [Chelonobacter oris]KGQ69912.1 hypothetical protein OA57_09815 [Chelonobacter oris]
MNPFHRCRKPHFWSQFLLGMLAIMSLPVNASLSQNQPAYDQAYQQSQQLQQHKPASSLFYQQQQRQIRLQQQVIRELPHYRPVIRLLISRQHHEAVPPIRAGPYFSF